MVRPVADTLRALREYRGLSQAQCATLMRCSRGTINNIEVGRKNPSLTFLLTVANQFQVSLDSVLRYGGSLEPYRFLPQVARRELQYFGINLRHFRKTQSITQHDLAQQLGLKAQGYISFLEHGQKYPSIDILVALAEMFDVTLDAFFLPPA